MVALFTIFYLMLASLSACIKENEKKLSRLTLLWNSMLISFYMKSYSFNEAQKNKKQRLVLFMTWIHPISLFFIHSMLNKDFILFKKWFHNIFFLHSLVMLLAYHIKKRKLLSWKLEEKAERIEQMTNFFFFLWSRSTFFEQAHTHTHKIQSDLFNSWE